jgi:coenzyme F420 hydrogenase subunit beta
MERICDQLTKRVVRRGICTGCGACVALDSSGRATMVDTAWGPQPRFEGMTGDLPELAWTVCPGKGLSYPRLYEQHYGLHPASWLLGQVIRVRTGYAADPAIRRNGASGGVTTQVLVHLLETRRIDGAIVVQQGIPEPARARVNIARSRDEIMAAAQSVYVPVSVLDILRGLKPGERYAMTCVPDQASALRALQAAGHAQARQVEYVVGPYTGTALYPAAIACYLRSKGVARDDAITSLKWRAGEWPGYLEIKTASGKVLQSKKVYYNFLIPFFITQNSLQNMDFANEFCDLSIGDAWSPRFEAAGGGHSVITTRTAAMERIISDMAAKGLLVTEDEDPLRASEMHGHMMDFKKRGGYIRNRMRRLFGRAAPDFGMKPSPLPLSRVLVELVVSGIFLVAGTWPARKIVELIPESVIGPLFNRLRLGWKGVSKPTKRKGLGNLTMRVTPGP